MSTEVKRYAFRLSQLSEIMGGRLEVVEYSGDGLPYVLATDYDALHAEAEALRDENGRLKRTVEEGMPRLMQQGYELRTQLEAARGLLRHASSALGIEGWESLSHEIDTFLTATPAPEVRCQTCDGTGDVHRADGEWLGDCHCVKAEQGERQEPFVWMRPDGDESFELTNEGDYLSFPLYRAPQPGPDVRALVEALRTVVGLLQHKATTPLEQEAVLMADKALATHRQAQRQA
ncbi:hypothetical protein ACNFCJ_23815 [Pseudomonas sp. NY15364]|uniref:hypothetical protein n=1 Tax=Pseudomonas sp. NY15364 TaxID=3400353 RepID=UPI003A87922C